MINSIINNQLVKQTLTSAKTIAMVGVSFIKKEVPSSVIKRRPSVIVMKYLQEFGYKVIPVNPSSIGKERFHPKDLALFISTVVREKFILIKSFDGSVFIMTFNFLSGKT